MGEENRSSSGSSTAMIVMAILGGILLVGCCGGVVAVGLGGTLLWSRSVPMEMQVAPTASPQMSDEPLQVIPDDLSEPIRSDQGIVPPPEVKAPGIESLLPPSRVFEETKE